MKKLLVFISIFSLILSNTSLVFADETAAINFIKSKQDSTGKITQGYSNPSQWTAIALMASRIDISTVKNPTNSLKDFLLTDHPESGASATDWENRILSIVAIGDNPTSFDGVDYLQNLEGFYNNNQIGETYLLNDDIFGLLALIASGSLATQQIKQDTLDFIITHQASNGGFSWSPDTTCQFCDPSADMTAAALQALQEAKDDGLTNSGLDIAIDNAKSYLLSNQNPDGGFGYFGTSDADSTSWVLMAHNVLGTSSSSEATNAKNWLISQQQSDGGFPSFSGSDTTTSSHSLIALSGKSWILSTYNPASSTATPSATPTPTTTPTPSPTPTPTLSPTPTPTPTVSPSNDPQSTSTPTPTPTPLPVIEVTETSKPSSPEVLGEAISNIPSEIIKPSNKELLIKGFKNNALPVTGVFSLFTMFKYIEGRRWKR